MFDMNLLITDPTAPCLEQHGGLIQYCMPPSDWNPHAVSSLAELKVSYLINVVPYNKTHDEETNTYNDLTCPAASKLLPISDFVNLNMLDAPDRILRYPANISVGALELGELALRLFPAPLNESSPGAVVDWWINATRQDAENVTLFLDHVSRQCWHEYCRSTYVSIGNPDIVGYGMFVSAIMLIILTVVFSSLSFSPISKRIAVLQRLYLLHRRPKKRRCNFRLSLVRTLPGLLISTLVFGASVMVSSYVYRWTTHSRFDALMADALSMLSATSVVMVCAAYWATSTHPYSRGYVTGSVVLVALNVVLFATHFSIFYKPGKIIERLCSQRYDAMTPDQEFHHSDDFFYFLGGFVCWVLAAVGTAFHHPRLRRYRVETGSRHAAWVTAEALPTVAGVVSLAVYSRYYWRTRGIMKEVYGDAFVAAIKTWGFGQYLALATWFPPVLHFLYLYLVPWNGVDEEEEEDPEKKRGSKGPHERVECREWEA